MTDKTSLKILFSCKNLDWALSVLQVEDIFIISKEIDINKEEEEEEVEDDDDDYYKYLYILQLSWEIKRKKWKKLNNSKMITSTRVVDIIKEEENKREVEVGDDDDEDD